MRPLRHWGDAVALVPCDTSAMVKTGARAAVLERLLLAAGYRPAARPPSPRLESLTADSRESVINLYRALGGRSDVPRLRPGAWDLAFNDGLVVELDEELHFNRYRGQTLGAPLPWRDDYAKFCSRHEPECLAAGKWGSRWSTPSCEALFGASDPPGTFGTGGAARWKQRALYDAMKDVWCSEGRVRLARVSVHDLGVSKVLGGAFDADRLDLKRIATLVEGRSHPTG